MKKLFVIGITFTLACGVFAAQSRKLDIDVSGWTLGNGPFSGFALSPDGKSIAFLWGRAAPRHWIIS